MINKVSFTLSFHNLNTALSKRNVFWLKDPSVKREHLKKLLIYIEENLEFN